MNTWRKRLVVFFLASLCWSPYLMTPCPQNDTLSWLFCGIHPLVGICHAGDDELLINLPGNTPEGRTAPPYDPEVIIPLPGEPGTHTGRIPPKKKGPEIISIPVDSATETTSIIISPSQEPPVPPPVEIAPPPLPPPTSKTPVAAVPQATPTSPAGAKTTLPAFPKDTSSAVFMLMKTWECDKYDGGTLLTHAIGVYGQEAEDKFEVKGIDALPKFTITMKEEDVTLDELLDILSNKHGFDWGVDIPGKTIYLYPNR